MNLFIFQIKQMKLVSTCSFTVCDSKLEDLIVKCWSKACPKCNTSVLQNFIWFKYIQSLTYLTDSYVENFENSANLTKVIINNNLIPISSLIITITT